MRLITLSQSVTCVSAHFCVMAELLQMRLITLSQRVTCVSAHFHVMAEHLQMRLITLSQRVTCVSAHFHVMAEYLQMRLITLSQRGMCLQYICCTMSIVAIVTYTVCSIWAHWTTKFSYRVSKKTESSRQVTVDSMAAFLHRMI